MDSPKKVVAQGTKFLKPMWLDTVDGGLVWSSDVSAVIYDNRSGVLTVAIPLQFLSIKPTEQNLAALGIALETIQ